MLKINNISSNGLKRQQHDDDERKRGDVVNKVINGDERQQVEVYGNERKGSRRTRFVLLLFFIK